MKKLSIVLVSLLFVIISYFFASPYIAVYSIKSSIKNNDLNRLSDYIDFPLLRQNFKDQLNLHFIKSAGNIFNDNPFGAIGMAFASKITEGMVDSLITPYGISHLFYGKADIMDNKSQKSKEDMAINRGELFSGASYNFKGLDRFIITIPMNDKKTDSEIIFCLNRYGLMWKLTNIEFPYNKVLKDATTKGENSESFSSGKQNKMAEDLNGNLKISTYEISSKFIENKSCGRLFVITGKARNDYNNFRKNICITGKLYTEGKTLVRESTIYCGNILSDIELSESSEELIQKSLKNSNGENMSNTQVPPGGEIQFMIVFSELPLNLDEFAIQASGSKEA